MELETEVAQYYKAEVERLQTLLRAEQSQNQRLQAAISLYSMACGLQAGVLLGADSTDLDSDHCHACVTMSLKYINEANALVVPLASSGSS
jgi:hypothetical protein